MNASAIAGLSLEEKLGLMEAIWDSLTADEARFESPAWHAEALQETEARFRSGDEALTDLDEVEKKLRTRARES